MFRNIMGATVKGFHLMRMKKLLVALLSSLLVLMYLVNINRHNASGLRDYLSRFEESETFHPNENGVCTGSRWTSDLPPLYIITPTYPRAEQIPELTRLGQTLLHMDSLVWIVAEDARTPSQTVKDYLKESGHCFVYLHSPMPSQYKSAKSKPRGVANRNAGLQWIWKNARVGGVVYFADDDNTYDIRLFNEIRFTKKISMFPVGLVAKLGVSAPIVKNNKVIGFYDGWRANRRFPVDMAGFAFSVDYFKSLPEMPVMPFKASREETMFLEALNITNSDIEILADQCTKILVWHTKTQKNKPAIDQYENEILDSNIIQLKQLLWRGVSESNKTAKSA